MKVIIGIAGILLIGAVIWTIVSIWRHPKTDPIVNNPTPTATADPSITPTPTPTVTQAPSNTATGTSTPRNTGTSSVARAKSAETTNQTQTFSYSGDIATTITTETTDEWGNRHVETRTETARW